MQIKVIVDYGTDQKELSFDSESEIKLTIQHSSHGFIFRIQDFKLNEVISGLLPTGSEIFPLDIQRVLIYIDGVLYKEIGKENIIGGIYHIYNDSITPENPSAKGYLIEELKFDLKAV